MKSFIYLIFLVVGSNLFLNQDELPTNAPKHLAIALDWKGIQNSQLAFSFHNPDTLLSHEMYLLKDANNLPLLYYADLQTPVCIDGLCKPLYIEMYWDLTGQYVGYGEYTEQQLSKYDHDLFEQENYLKLHQLLSNRYSILGKRKKKALYNIQQTRINKIKFKGQEIDGVSGATKKEVKNEIVAGALYSCYTLWHIAYGDAVDKIKSQLPLIYTDSLEHNFLNSKWGNHQLYAVKHLPKDKFQEKLNELVHILKQAKPLTRAYILKKMPKELFGHPIMETELYPHFANLDFNSKTHLVEALPYSNASIAMELSKHLAEMSKNQLQSYLFHLTNNTALQTELLVKQMRNISKDSNFIYSHLINEFLVENK